MEVAVSAVIKTQRKVRRSPMSRVSERVPYVLICVPFTTSSVMLVVRVRRSTGEGGITLTCAPVSTKNLVPVERSVT